ncbi:hypothetical protein [Marinobacter changyiensis]|uniref:hypothetical protein n=1 Tax=Marinobacter changyiensis TaxID=2604091 RepID=UPI00126538B5|nr:hypothetical protein [Marinobacter changyiensis]
MKPALQELDVTAEPNRKAWKVLGQWQNPFLTASNDSHLVTRGADKYFQKFTPGAPGTGARHY